MISLLVYQFIKKACKRYQNFSKEQNKEKGTKKKKKKGKRKKKENYYKKKKKKKEKKKKKKRKEKSNKMVMKVTKICQMMKTKSFLSIEKNIRE